MGSVIQTLETQHRAVEKEIVTLEHSLKTSDLPALRASLDRMQTMLAAHFTLEHRDFYPPLLAKVAGDAQTHRTVSLFHENLQRIAEGVTAFFKRWKAPLTTEALPRLKEEWRTTLKILAARLRDEEGVLHPLSRKWD